MARQRRNVASLVVATAVSLAQGVLVRQVAVAGYVWQPTHRANPGIPRLQELGCVVAGLLLDSRGSTKEQVSKVLGGAGWSWEEDLAAASEAPQAL